jgi:hypothetical protein
MILSRSQFLLRCLAPLVLLCSGGAAPGLAAQEPTLKDALRNVAAYVANFQRQLSTIVAEETYVQEIKHQQTALGHPILLPRRLRSDLMLVRPANADRYVEFRDVFEVDGSPVRDRDERLTRMLNDPGAGDSLSAIIRESARYNIGNIERNVNTPLLALQFLDAASQSRFTFKRELRSAPVLRDSSARVVTDAPLFKVSTETWIVAYQERRRNTIVRTPRGDDLPARGRFWINPESGAVLMSELVIQGGDLTATITVSYQSEPLMGFLVPVEMRETYIALRERVEGRATYGRFRSLK